jgi:hypothetical protein
MNKNKIANEGIVTQLAVVHTMLPKVKELIDQQQSEIESLKNANRFIQNFAEEQHQRAVALEMRELTDEEIHDLIINKTTDAEMIKQVLKKAQEK